jgi:type 1 glutamine amidotransferase
MKKALIFQGGWQGHDPELVANRFAGVLREAGFEVDVTESLDCLDDYEKLFSYDLIVPEYTQGEITQQQAINLANAVGHGVGLAGCHGGMCDAFRGSVLYQFMTGSQWVAHPGMDGVDYRVNVLPLEGSLMEGIEDFAVCSEQYYLHVDPAVKVLATTRFPVVFDYNMTNPPVEMPVVYTKAWGLGRVFYSSLGHLDELFEKQPACLEIMRRGMLWAAEGKLAAMEKGEGFKFSYSPAKAMGMPRCFL